MWEVPVDEELNPFKRDSNCNEITDNSYQTVPTWINENEQVEKVSLEGLVDGNYLPTHYSSKVIY